MQQTRKQQVAVYVRVSDGKLTDTGERRQDIKRQIERLRPYAGKSAAIYADDDKSAYKEDYSSRPEFCRLLREIRANRVDKVYLESLDRWSRRVVDGILTLTEAAEHGCTITSIAENEIDITSAEGWFRTNIALMMAEWASRQKSELVKSAMQRRANDKRKMCRSCGIVHLGRHPLTCECGRCRGKKGRSGNRPRSAHTPQGLPRVSLSRAEQ